MNPNSDAILGAFRALLIVIGTAMAAKGWIRNDDVNQIVSAFLVLGPVGWALADRLWVQPKKIMTAVQAGQAIDSSVPSVTTPKEAVALIKTVNETVMPSEPPAT